MSHSFNKEQYEALMAQPKVSSVPRAERRRQEKATKNNTAAPVYRRMKGETILANGMTGPKGFKIDTNMYYDIPINDEARNAFDTAKVKAMAKIAKPIKNESSKENIQAQAV